MKNKLELSNYNFTVNLQKIVLNNFKNVSNGEVVFQSYKYREKISKKIKKAKKDNIEYDYNIEENLLSDIIGLYGQNGSGKTSIVDGINLFKCIASGQKIPSYVNDFIGNKGNSIKLEFTFYINDNLDNKYSEQLLTYVFEIGKVRDKLNIIYEKMYTYFILNDEIESRRKNLIEFKMNASPSVKPNFQNDIVNASYSKNALEVANELAQLTQTSFIFGEKAFNVLSNSVEILKIPLISLKAFAMDNLVVIRNDRLRAQENDEPIPFNLIIYNSFDRIVKEYLVSYNKPINLSLDEFNIFKKTIESSNIVIGSIIPGLQIEVNEVGDKTLQDGTKGKMIELLSVRDGIKSPLVCESDGIKKIIAIVSAIIAMVNDKKVCLVVDELDAGVYEYLLGEILYVLENDAEGQFLFTSHNLRALETLSKDAIVFTTTNPENRYIRFLNIKSTNNLRDLYIRSLKLGGQKEWLYNNSDRNDIGYSFYNAWEDGFDDN